MNKKISLGAAIAFMLIVATATFSMTMVFATNIFNQTVVALKEREVQFEKFSQIDLQTRQKYYGTVNETQLMDSVASGYMNGLGDDYAMYIDAKAYDKLLRSQRGTISGIGAVLSSNPGDGYLTVERVYAESPAQAAGIEAGDVIVRIDETDLTPENSARMLEAVQGESGTRLSLVVRRGSEDIPITDITRRPVVIPSVHASMLVDTQVGYIWIEEFNDNSVNQFNTEIQRVLDNGATSLIFDLRDNPGGSVRPAVRMLERILSPGEHIASYTAKDGTQEVFTDTTNKSVELPMTVLVNDHTASASELFAQVLKYYNKARIVGVNTMGKGVIQETVQLSDGSAIRLTIAELIGPGGETFNKVGVKPDYEITLAPDQNWKELPQDQDAQLIKALEVVQGIQRAAGSAGNTQGEASEPQGNEAPSQPQAGSSSEPAQNSEPDSLPESPDSSAPDDSSSPEQPEIPDEDE